MRLRSAIVALLILVSVVHESSARRRPAKVKPPVDVNELCGRLRCPKGTYCRVIEKCGKKRKSQAKCLPCVPQGCDDVCNAHNYWRAVLVGPSKSLEPLNCHLYDVVDKFECPHGADCVPNPQSPGHGICCYGSVYNIHSLETTNSDRQCDKCKEPCGDGYSCVEDVVCGVLKYICKPDPEIIYDPPRDSLVVDINY